MGLMDLNNNGHFDFKSQMLKNRNMVLYGQLIDEDYKTILNNALFLNSISTVEPINLFICSTGGDVDSGVAIYDLMQWISAPVYTIGMGLCASMAAVLLMAGKKRYVFPHCWVMLHQCSGMVYGDTDTTISRANQMQRQEKQLLEIQAFHTGKTAKQIAKDNIKEKWFNAEETIKYGIADEIIRPDKLNVALTEKQESEMNILINRK